jgi:hypothetical protein
MRQHCTPRVLISTTLLLIILLFLPLTSQGRIVRTLRLEVLRTQEKQQALQLKNDLAGEHIHPVRVERVQNQYVVTLGDFPGAKSAREYQESLQDENLKDASLIEALSSVMGFEAGQIVYQLEAGQYSKEQEALAQKDRLSGLGLHPTSVISEDGRYIVRTGLFRNQQGAVEALEDFRKAGYEQARVVLSEAPETLIERRLLYLQPLDEAKEEIRPQASKVQPQLYQGMMGPYDNRQEAVNQSGQLKEDGFRGISLEAVGDHYFVRIGENRNLLQADNLRQVLHEWGYNRFSLVEVAAKEIPVDIEAPEELTELERAEGQVLEEQPDIPPRQEPDQITKIEEAGQQTTEAEEADQAPLAPAEEEPMQPAEPVEEKPAGKWSLDSTNLLILLAFLGVVILIPVITLLIIFFLVRSMLRKRRAKQMTAEKKKEPQMEKKPEAEPEASASDSIFEDLDFDFPAPSTPEEKEKVEPWMAELEGGQPTPEEEVRETTPETKQVPEDKEEPSREEEETPPPEPTAKELNETEVPQERVKSKPEEKLKDQPTEVSSGDIEEPVSAAPDTGEAEKPEPGEESKPEEPEEKVSEAPTPPAFDSAEEEKADTSKKKEDRVPETPVEEETEVTSEEEPPEESPKEAPVTPPPPAFDVVEEKEEKEKAETESQDKAEDVHPGTPPQFEESEEPPKQEPVPPAFAPAEEEQKPEDSEQEQSSSTENETSLEYEIPDEDELPETEGPIAREYTAPPMKMVSLLGQDQEEKEPGDEETESEEEKFVVPPGLDDESVLEEEIQPLDEPKSEEVPSPPPESTTPKKMVSLFDAPVSGDTEKETTEESPVEKEEPPVEMPAAEIQSSGHYQQNFDAMEIGTQPEQWQGDYESASLVISQNRMIAGEGHFLKMVKENSEESVLYSSDLPPAGSHPSFVLDLCCLEVNQEPVGLHLENTEHQDTSIDISFRASASPGEILLEAGGHSYSYSSGDWLQFRIDVDLKKSSFSLWLDEGLVFEHESLSSAIDSFDRITLSATPGSTGTLLLKQMKIIRGD